MDWRTSTVMTILYFVTISHGFSNWGKVKDKVFGSSATEAPTDTNSTELIKTVARESTPETLEPEIVTSTEAEQEDREEENDTTPGRKKKKGRSSKKDTESPGVAGDPTKSSFSLLALSMISAYWVSSL